MPAQKVSLRLRLYCVSLSAAGWLTGCGGGASMPTTYSVSGAVTLDGKPMAAGSIVFDSADGKGQPAGGGIKDGAFSLKSSPGDKIVRISASKETGEKDEYGSPVSVELVGEAFNRNSTLKFTVKPEAMADARFEVQSPAAKK